MEEKPAVQAEEAAVATQAVESSNFQTIVKQLISEGATKVTGIRIKNCNCTEKDNYNMVSFTLDKKIEGYVSEDNGATYELGVTNFMYTSTYAIAGTMKEDEELSWMANTIISNPKVLNLVLNGSLIDIVQRRIPANTEFVNPFSTNANPEPQLYDHDIVINYIVKIKLGKTATKMADKLADKLMDIEL